MCEAREGGDETVCAINVSYLDSGWALGVVLAF
jgi:hypothetical protein